MAHAPAPAGTYQFDKNLAWNFPCTMLYKKSVFPPMNMTEFLRAASKRERAEVAERCDTTVPYLYQLAGRHRNAGVPLAARIEAHTADLASRTQGRLREVPGRTLVLHPEQYKSPVPEDA